jgi:hypothetical protein
LRHVDAAYGHLSRGQHQQDESAFTDAIYRTNQAFEGSIKEAYRVLAGRDPQKTTPHSIELYLQKNGLFRQRVLAQFSMYRTEWRNPSAHDYNLDFDKDEAFLAIVSVSAFAKLLIDQISEKLAFVAVKEDIETHNMTMPTVDAPDRTLLDRAADTCLKFLQDYIPRHSVDSIHTETQFLGALAAFLSSVEYDISLYTNQTIELPNGRRFETDMILVQGTEKIVVELKRYKPRVSREYGLRQLESYLSHVDASGGILLIHRDDQVPYQADTYQTPSGKAIRIIEPSATPRPRE